MPDSMNFANSQPLGYDDPNNPAYPQAGMPEWGNQYGQQMSGVYPQDMYQQPDMGQGYIDPMTGQPIVANPYPNDMYYQNGYMDPMQQGYMTPEMEAERAARQAQIRSSSIFGPKEASMDMGMGQQPDMGMSHQDMAAAIPDPSVMPNAQMPGYGAQQGQGMLGGQMGQQMGQQMSQQPQQVQQPQQQTQSYPEVPNTGKKRKGRKGIPAVEQVEVPQEPMYLGEPPSGGAATAALILGLLSILFALIPPIGIVLGLVAKKIAKGYFKKGGVASRAESGRVFGTVGFVFSIVMLCVMVLLVVYIAGALYGESNARAIVIYFNNSPLGNLFYIPLPSVL